MVATTVTTTVCASDYSSHCMLTEWKRGVERMPFTTTDGVFKGRGMCWVTSLDGSGWRLSRWGAIVCPGSPPAVPPAGQDSCPVGLGSGKGATPSGTAHTSAGLGLPSHVSDLLEPSCLAPPSPLRGPCNGQYTKSNPSGANPYIW